MCVCDEGEVYGSGQSTTQPLLRYPKEYSRVHTVLQRHVLHSFSLLTTVSPRFPPFVMDSTVIVLDRQCLGLRRRSQRQLVGSLIGASESQQARKVPGFALGPRLQVVSEGPKGGCDLIARYHRVDKAMASRGSTVRSTAPSDLHDAIVANSCPEETISTS